MPRIATLTSPTSFTVTNGLFKQTYPTIDSSTNLVNNIDGSYTLYLLSGDEVVNVVSNTQNSPYLNNSIFGSSDPLTAQTAAQTAIGTTGSGGGGGGGGGGGVATSPADIAFGINQAVDIDTLLLRIANIDSKIPVGGYESKQTIIRPNGAGTLQANTVFGRFFELPNFGASGGHVILSGVRVIFNNLTIPSGMAGFILFLYSGIPPSAVSDGGAFSIPPGDRVTLLTPKGIDLENAEIAIGGGSVVLQVDNKNIQLKLAPGSTSVWGYLVNRSAYTSVQGQTAVVTVMNLGV